MEDSSDFVGVSNNKIFASETSIINEMSNNNDLSAKPPVQNRRESQKNLKDEVRKTLGMKKTKSTHQRDLSNRRKSSIGGGNGGKKQSISGSYHNIYNQNPMDGIKLVQIKPNKQHLRRNLHNSNQNSCDEGNKRESNLMLPPIPNAARAQNDLAHGSTPGRRNNHQRFLASPQQYAPASKIKTIERSS